MDEDGAVLVDLLQVDDELGRIMLGVGENLCTEESDDMIRDHWDGLVAEIRIVDAQLGVKPVDLVRDEFSGDEALYGCDPIRIGCAAEGLEGMWCTLDATST
jgi:hypothetical protein